MMLAQQRRNKILDLLKEDGSARVSKLSKVFEVTEPTIRQDLERLENEGLVTREHGGAFLRSVPDQVKTMSLHHTENMDMKVRIGKKAAEFIQNGDSIILDSGTTITEVAKNLDDKKDLRIITDALNIALMLGARTDFDIMVTGGEFKAPTLSLTGDKAALFFDQIHVNRLFMAAGGISLEAGLTFPGFNDLKVKRAMMQSADEIYVVADSTKIGKTSFVALGGIEMIHFLVTDSGIRQSDRDGFEKLGIQLIVV